MSKLIQTEHLQSIGLRWQAFGQSVLSGPLFELLQRVDRSIVELAKEWHATEFQFPTLIAARELGRLDYFRSFPHLATFATYLDPEEANLKQFTQGDVLDEQGALQFTRTAPVREVLTPAACYHLYIHQQGTTLNQASYYTTRNTCFRRETHYEALRRQWGFSMREIVCLGTLDEVKAFLTRGREQVNNLLSAAGLSIEWTNATDPFFRPSAQAKYLAQVVNPTKIEAVFGGDLAIASINLHQDHFGSTYEIQRSGAAAYSGCIAFGLERWLYAILTQHGVNPAHWPTFSDVADAQPKEPHLTQRGGL